MPDVTATEIARGVRLPGYKTPGPGSPPPPPFLVKPTTVGRKAVRVFHEQGAGPARTYLTGSLATWLAHANKSMQGNARNTVAALETYIAADAADGRTFVGLGQKVVLTMPSGTIAVKVDVVTERSKELSGRAIFWDGQPITINEAEVIAYAYAAALQRMYPNEIVSDVCVWQVRRGTLHTVPLAAALARATDADAVLARL
jgi:hypothetical protein